jgi:hypothetical protein
MKGGANINNPQKTVKLPANLSEIREAAASMFLDSAVVSVNVQSTFGTVTVFRNGEIFMK